MTTLATDDFNRADGGLGSNWTTLTGFAAPQIATNTATDNGGADSGAIYSGVSIPDNHWAQVVRTGADGGGVVLRGTAGGTAQYYVVNIEGTFGASAHVVFGEFNGAAFTSNSDQVVTFNSGDTLYAEMQGSQCVVKRNGAALGSAMPTDSTWTTGDPGIFGFTGYVADDFAAGDFASGMGAVIARAEGPGRAPFMARKFPGFKQGQTAAAGVNLTLDIDTPGSITVAGQSMTMTLGVAVSTQGSITVAGQSVGLTLGLAVSSPGSITVAGQSMTFAMNVALGAGSITVAGQSVLMNIGVDLSAAGSITIQGQAVTTAFSIDLQPGSITINGQDVTLLDSGAGPAAAADEWIIRARRRLRH